MSPAMQGCYKVFGDAVSFDITYKICSASVVVSDGEKERECYWNLGVFSTFIEDCRPVICGICFILDETIPQMCSLFRMLFRITGKFPQSIITDQQRSVISALEELKK